MSETERDALCFQILQNMPPTIAQSFFWNFSSRRQRRKAILAWKADQEINAPVASPTPATSVAGPR
jgi:hypothetical protein